MYKCGKGGIFVTLGDVGSIQDIFASQNLATFPAFDITDIFFHPTSVPTAHQHAWSLVVLASELVKYQTKSMTNTHDSFMSQLWYKVLYDMYNKLNSQDDAIIKELLSIQYPTWRNGLTEWLANFVKAMQSKTGLKKDQIANLGKELLLSDSATKAENILRRIVNNE